MANNGGPALDVLLNCALCNITLLDAQAKSLACLHSFCSSCFEKTFSTEEEHFGHDTNLSCPICHIDHAQTSEDGQAVESLQLDTFVQKLLQARHIQQSGQTCEMCTEDEVNALSAHWCQDCSKFLCERCEVWHRRLRPNDHVINLANGESQKLENFISPTKCSLHEKRIKAYCPQCRTCMCSLCLLEHCFGENACSWAVTVESEAPGVRLEGQSILEKMELLAQTMRQQGEEMKNRISKRITRCSERKKQIREHTEEIIRSVRDNTNDLIDNLEAKTQKDIDGIQGMIQLKEDHFKQLEILNSNIQHLLNLADDADVLLHFPNLKSKWETLQDLHMDLYSVHCQYVSVEYNIWYIEMFRMLKKFLYSFKPEGMESPLDMCAFSDSVICVVAGSDDLFLIKRERVIRRSLH